MKRFPIGSHARQSHRGFTLIEVLVVVAIIALLVSILLPALGRAREQTRTTMCTSGLKQLGQAIMMYQTDAKSTLPGPVHPAIYRWTDDWIKYDNAAKASGADQNWWRSQLPGMVRRYLQSNRAAAFDAAGTCPTSERIMPLKEFDAQSASAPDRRPIMYVLNTIEAIDSIADNRSVPPVLPNIGTDPAYYFGRMNSGDSYKTGAFPVEGAGAKPRYKPKKIDRVKQPTREWMMADVWWWSVSGRPVGTWPFPSSITYTMYDSDNKRWLMPNYPFHLAGSSYSAWNFSGTNPDQTLKARRFQDGKTNQLFFDGHAETVRGFKGTVNPCMVDRGC